MPVHVSLHDVSPAWEGEVERALAAAAQYGIRPALLVVPNFHGRYPLGEHPRFVERLVELQSQGHEIYLHGYYHQAGQVGRSNTGGSPTQYGIGSFWAQSVVSRGEAEFADISRREALDRIDRGTAELRALGLRIDGFVPPAWAMPKWLPSILAARNIAFTEDRLGVMAPTTGERRRTLLMNYASRTRSRMISSLAFCRMVEPFSAFAPTRLAIHPGDMKVPLLCRELERLLARASRDLVARAAGLFHASSRAPADRADYLGPLVLKSQPGDEEDDAIVRSRVSAI
jgi:predicted deacetylase